MTAQRIYDTVADDFSRVNDLIIKRLSSDVPMVEKIAHYIIESGGKRLRPLLVLLSSRAAGYRQDEHLKLAAVIEFLHTATLLHDDVVDTSDMRRGRSTANARWGNAPSVLVGDFLYARAFEMMVELQNLRIMDVLSHATAVIAEGEVMQLMNVKNPDLDESQYMEVIHNKTAMLF
ncbi:MAG: polyprenyl synthetase family protein, partial [Marinobacter sp.]|nr:polyprenyl synthetase family protein [Marinobacter sp.]